MLISGPLSNIKNYMIRVEFQVRESPQVQSFLWVVNAPVNDEDPDLYVQ